MPGIENIQNGEYEDDNENEDKELKEKFCKERDEHKRSIKMLIRKVIHNNCVKALRNLIPAMNRRRPKTETRDRNYFLVSTHESGEVFRNQFCDIVIEETTEENDFVGIELIGEGDPVYLSLSPPVASHLAATILQSITRTSKEDFCEPMPEMGP